MLYSGLHNRQNILELIILLIFDKATPNQIKSLWIKAHKINYKALIEKCNT